VTFTATNPFSGEVVCSLPTDDRAAIAQKVERARAAFREWARVPLEERVRAAAAAVAWFERAGDEVARDLTRQMGKPITQAQGEVRGMLGRAEWLLGAAPDALRPDLLPPKEGLVRRIDHVPLGVVLNISAWNYPLLIAVNVVLPAVLAGNAVLLKPSPRTPLSGVWFERAFEGHVPDGLVQGLFATHDDIAALLAGPGIDHVAFTGSVEGGRAVQRAASGRFVDVGLELGGKDAAYVADDADLDSAVPNVIDGACYNAGQSCCAVERVYVHRKHYDEFLTRAARELAHYRIGDPLDPATTMGPLAHRTALDVLDRQVKDARARGARVLCGGTRSDCGRFFLPTLLADCPQEALVMQDESFGPLVPVAPVESDDEAIAGIDDSRYGLTASVWTTDRARAERFVRELDVGTVYQNRCDFLDPAQPWTGVRDSGKGSTLSRYGFWQLTRRKSVHLRDA
jgi:acyl-CoA reductase-like NAD-dependent aldehyde dehydrogenase